MSKALIFVSCGQCATEEKDLGQAIKDAIDQTAGLEAYFAEFVHDLEALGRHIFEALHRCAGAVVILHPRGEVLEAGGEPWGIRSSVWINQEIAVLAYRQFSERRSVPILVFRDASVKLEGAMTSLIVNPRPLGTTSEVVSAVKAWLTNTSFAPVSEDIVGDAWDRLSESGRKALTCILEAGGSEISQSLLHRTLMRRFSISADDVGHVVQRAAQEFASTGIASRAHRDSGHVFSVHAGWEPEVRRRIEQWQRG